jgi:hypothetical protein
MLNKLRELGRFGSPRSDHPLADPREVRRIIDAIPAADSFKAVDDILGWLESLEAAADFPAASQFPVLARLDDAAQPHLRRLARNYLQTPRLSRAEELRLRRLSQGFWTLMAAGYERCLASAGAFAGDALADLSTRLLVALGNVIKWERFQFAPPPGVVWQRLGAALLAAEAGGVADRLVSVPGAPGGLSGAQREFLRRVAFEAASVDSLLPLQVELAERLVSHVLPGFVIAERAEHDSVYWVDLGQPRAPTRMADMPERAEAGQRFFKPAAAHAALAALLHELERGHDVPPDINLGGQYPAHVLVPVLRHLATYLAPIPPQRRHPRHAVRQRASVANGMAAAWSAFSGQSTSPALARAESWVVHDVSRGGFGARVGNSPGEWLKVGALVVVQPEGGSNWVLGVIRRYLRLAGNEAQVGIETLARRPLPTELRALSSSTYVVAEGMPALLIREECHPGELRAVLPHGCFGQRDTMECFVEGRRTLLQPAGLLESGDDWELARYRCESGA